MAVSVQIMETIFTILKEKKGFFFFKKKNYYGSFGLIKAIFKMKLILVCFLINFPFRFHQISL